MSAPYPILHNGQGSAQGIWDESEDPQYAVGTRGSLEDGRVFYYAKNAGTALVAGNLVMSEVITAQFEDLAVDTHVVGDTTINITTGTTAVTANEYAGGYLCVIDDTGEGLTYKIASHPAVAATTAGAFAIVDPINVAFAAGTTVCLVKNPWQDVVIAGSGHVHMACGVPQMAVTANYYFWCQTWGVTCAWQDAATAIGAALQSGTTAGQVEVNDGAAQYLGTVLYTGTIGENQPVFLQIAP